MGVFAPKKIQISVRGTAPKKDFSGLDAENRC